MTVLEKEIRRQLHEAGYDLNPEKSTYEDVADYLNLVNEEEELSEQSYYSIHDWIRDTAVMYPEYLVRL